MKNNIFGFEFKCGITSMLTFSSLGKRGNLGNQLFQIASTMGIALKNDQDYFFPEWQYCHFLEHDLPVGTIDETFEILFEKQFNYYEWPIGNGNYDLKGWVQSEKYFNIPATRKALEFKKEFADPLLERYSNIFSKKTILISVRRGDFVNNPYYYQLSYKYYFLALATQFPDWQERNLVFTSDDIGYCKKHFSFLENAIFLENLGAIEQLVIGKACDDYIISNSTFSWWMAWLGENENTKIIRPFKNLRGWFASQNNDVDYFPDRWIVFNDRGKLLPIKYISLTVKGELYRYKMYIKHTNRDMIVKTKKIVKKIIGYKTKAG